MASFGEEYLKYYFYQVRTAKQKENSFDDDVMTLQIMMIINSKPVWKKQKTCK